MLPALIEERHDDIDPVGLAIASGNDPFQILVMVVRGHMVGKSMYIVGDAVVAHIHQQKEILAADGFLDGGLALAASKAGRLHLCQIVVFAVALKGRVSLYLVVMDVFAEFHQIIVDSFSHFPCGGEGDDF